MFQRPKKLSKRHGSKNVDRKIYSKEKLFRTEQCYNTKNDLVCSVTFADIPENLLTINRCLEKNCDMFWAAE